MPEWFGRPYSARESRLVGLSEDHRPPAWRRVREALQRRAPVFHEALRAACRHRDIPLVDLNVEPRLLELDWVFIDRYHLTDAAQERVAEILALRMAAIAGRDDDAAV